MHRFLHRFGLLRNLENLPEKDLNTLPESPDDSGFFV
jgi:hypothetical protein